MLRHADILRLYRYMLHKLVYGIYIYKLFKRHCYTTVRSNFFSECIVNTWNNLPGNVDFSSLTSFVRTVKLADLSNYLR